MYGVRAALIDGDERAWRRHCSSFASMPTTQRRANARDTDARRRIDSSRLRPITGSMTLSSKLPSAPLKPIAASLPITCAAT